MSSRKLYPAVPEPIANVESLRQCVLALKQSVEVLTEQRKPLQGAAITVQDLIDLGIMKADGTPLWETGKLLNYLNGLYNTPPAVPPAYIAGPGTTTKGAVPVWDTAVGGSVIDGQGMVNAVAYGADPTGVADSATAINDALATGKLVYLPKGSYLINSGLTVTGAGLIGDDWGYTQITCDFTTGTAITVASSAPFVRIENLSITRVTTAVSDYGIDFVANNDYAVLRNVYLTKHYIGLHLGDISYAFVQFVSCVSNASHGVLINGNTGQWQILDFLSQTNGGDGFHCAGSTGIAVGQWRNLASYQNGGYGFYCTGYAQLRVSDSFFGSDNSHCVYVGTGGDSHYPHIFTSVVTELSVTGSGFFFDSGLLGGVTMVNCCAINNAGSGVINNSTANIAITGGTFVINGAAGGAGNTFGILNYAAGAKMTVMNVRADAVGSQTVAIASNPGTTACSIIGGQVANADISNSATNAYLAGNYA